jgi:hypothetical protein
MAIIPASHTMTCSIKNTSVITQILILISIV